jgi:hypothetical protein
MKFLDFWKSGPPPPCGDDINELETALAALAEKRADLERGSDTRGGRHHAALIADLPEAEIAKIDAEADLQAIALEKVEIYQQQLLKRLETARGEARKARWREL